MCRSILGLVRLVAADPARRRCGVDGRQLAGDALHHVVEASHRDHGGAEVADLLHLEDAIDRLLDDLRATVPIELVALEVPGVPVLLRLRIAVRLQVRRQLA
jgi:hypothetical protein